MTGKILIGVCVLSMAGAVAHGQEKLCETCVEYTLKRLPDRLQGSSLQFPGYDVSMRLPPAVVGGKLSVEGLRDYVAGHDVRGDFIFPDGRTTEIRYSVVPYQGSTTVFMKTSNGWFPWEHTRVVGDTVVFSYDYWYCPPASREDLRIFDLSLSYLQDAARWRRKDDRKCEDDEAEGVMSLFCALKIASIEVMGEYNHRNTAIQTARFVIDDLVPNHGYAHTLMDFNNAPTTTHQDVVRVLQLTRERIEEDLAKQR